MRKLVVTTFMTLDGVMQAPGGPGEDEDGGFSLGGWSVSYWDERMAEVKDAEMTPPFDLLLGRRTYDIFAAHWPNASEEEGAGPLNAATKYVASRGRPELSWENSVLLEGDLGDAVRRLKEDDGPELQVHGSATLVQSLLRERVVDEFHVWTFPVVVGSGKRLFGDGTVPTGLRLTDSAVSSTGVVMSTYVPVGDVPTGSFAAE